MAHIEQVGVTVITGNINGADTNGLVYLGMGGREFRLNKGGNQFEKGDTDNFQIGGVAGPDSINNQNNSNDPNFCFISCSNSHFLRQIPPA